MRYAYSIAIERDETGFSVGCPDIPELHTCGSTFAEAVERAQDALVTALSIYVDDGEPVPLPSARGELRAVVPALEAAKLALHARMLEANVSNVELGRRIGQDEKAVRRLRDLLHRSHIGQVEAALRVLGARVIVEVETAEPPIGPPATVPRAA